MDIKLFSFERLAELEQLAGLQKVQNYAWLRLKWGQKEVTEVKKLSNFLLSSF